MKMIEVPVFFHEVFGKRITKFELGVTILFSLIMSASLLAFTYSEWKELVVWKMVILTVLALDLTGGVIANFTFSTNDYYKKRPTARYIFICIHIQPLIFSLLFSNHFQSCIYVWGYTMVSVLIVNKLLQHSAQKVIAANFVINGIVGLYLFFSIPKLLFMMLFFYLFKVIYSFGVDHYAIRKE